MIGWKWASRLHPVWPSRTAGGVLQHTKRGHWLCSSLQQVALWTQSSFPNPSPLSSGSEEGEGYRISPQTQLFSLLLTKLEPTPFPQENSKAVLPPALTLPSPFFFLLTICFDLSDILSLLSPPICRTWGQTLSRPWALGQAGGLSPPHSRCHSGRWWRGPMWIAPVSLIEWTLQLCYVLNCMWLMPFFFRLQAGHSCFVKEIFIFLGRKKTQHYCKVTAMVLSMYSVIRRDQSPSWFSLPLFLVNRITCKKLAWSWFGPSQGLNPASTCIEYALSSNRAKYSFLYVILK